MAVTFIGVRHHSPACARLVADTIEREQPVHVLIEGPSDLNDRIDELALDHELPIAVFTSARNEQQAVASWSPFCEHSPEWVALRHGLAVGARVRFIDLPAWHPALAGRTNRYGDAEARYARAIEALCATVGVDNQDALWDHLFELAPAGELAEALTVYFDLLRGESSAGDDDETREAFMAGWIRAARTDAGDASVVVVTGGFHRPALVRLVADDTDTRHDWPEVPALPDGAQRGSYLVPFSFRRLDSFDGYQSGMPSPAYYQWLWEHGPAVAATRLTEAIVDRLRARKQPVSTADLIAARALARGLADLRGHVHPARTDVLDGLVGALVSDAMDVPLPWSRRGPLAAGTDPLVVEMVDVLSGSRRGRLHPDTPLPPLVHDVAATLARLDLEATGPVELELGPTEGRERSRALHRLRVLAIPGFDRHAGPTATGPPTFTERWTIADAETRLPALIEAGAYGRDLPEAAAARLVERLERDPSPGGVAAALFDAVLCGIDHLVGPAVDALRAALAQAGDLESLGAMLGTVVGLWRHDQLLGAQGAEVLGTVIIASVERVLWLVEGIHGGPGPAVAERLAAITAARDAIRFGEAALGVDRPAALAAMSRVADDASAPPDLRGASFGFVWALGAPERAAPTMVRGVGQPEVLGDWLSGLFALARHEVLSESDGAERVLDVIDDLVGAMSESQFLVAVPALRQAFEYFPPREREIIAGRVLERRGGTASARGFVRLAVSPEMLLAARRLELDVDEVLRREGLA